ncbi:lasso RiPP family leader peptide-containing protein [Streptomyces sp. NPDC006285]
MEQIERAPVEKASYEAPAVIELGEFATETGFLVTGSTEPGLNWPLYLW